ncbi:hypothetical protein SAMN05660657_03340 [Geodermatophilus amargosae]|uniref:Uncharacterized protein n=1 Tax=Geodermatophilus amargosae TaxID=1296565 RepID=A0A1I7B6K8_9ACTN|nr:hypothetical protein [Geodermatophilus amargosae]SFT82754.1 hypothetical protein SAMN05660657_03340 [Geodermatophilus amargosae]
MLELGSAGEAGAGTGEVPVLRDGEPVALLRSTDFWKEGSVAVVGDREWVLERRRGGVLVGRWAVDPGDSARFRAVQTSMWKGSWRADLEGTVVDLEVSSWWKGTHRCSTGGTTVAEGGSTGGWSPRPTLTAGDDVPLDAQVFLLWLLLVLNRRQYGVVHAVAIGGVVGGSS